MLPAHSRCCSPPPPWHQQVCVEASPEPRCLGLGLRLGLRLALYNTYTPIEK